MATVLRVEGMMCQKNCGTTVTNALQNAPGALRVAVRFDLGAALVEGAAANPEELVEAVEMMGFDAEVVPEGPERENLRAQLAEYLPAMQPVILTVEGMMCQKNCGTTVTNALKNTTGATRVIVSHAARGAMVEGTASAADLIEAVEMMGFDAEIVPEGPERESLRAQIEGCLPATQPVILAVEGMMCQKNCGTTVTNALKNTTGATRVIVSHAARGAMVEGTASAADLIEAVEMMGFDASEVTDAVERSALRQELEMFASQQSDTGTKPVVDLFLSAEEAHGRPEEEVALDVLPEGDGTKKSAGLAANRRRAEVQIRGMTCASCVANVESNLPKVEGIFTVGVGLIAEKASVEYDCAVLDGRQIALEVDKLGYKGTLIEDNLPCDMDTQGVGVLQLLVRNMAGNDLERSLIEPLRTLEGVLAASLGEDGTLLKIRHMNETIGARDLFEFVERSGVHCELASKDAGQDDGDDMATYYRRRFFGSLVFTVPVVFLSMVCPHIPPIMVYLLMPSPLVITWHALLLWALATPVQVFFAGRFYRNAWNAVSHGSANMDVLVVLGTSSAYLYSMISLLVVMAAGESSPDSDQDAHFFETSAMLISFILLGKYLESAARSRTADAITALMDLQVDTAILVESSPDSKSSSGMRDERVIDLRLVQVGDELKVLPGKRVPVDGVVVSGSSTVDEAMLTGEAAPVSKSAGSAVTGCTVNGHGVLYMRATRVGGDTALAQIMKLVEDAQTSKAPIQEYADRISKVFVPMVVLLALATWIGWFVTVFFGKPAYLDDVGPSGAVVFAFKFGVAVLVISCPCALGLATPTAVMVSTGVGAKHGILIKGGDAIEMGSKITSVVFDKTGTITKGKPTVSEVLNVGCRSEAEFLALVGAAEMASEHPVAKAITKYARQQRVEMLGAPSEFEAMPGFGIDCTFPDGTRIIVGNRKLMKRNKVQVTDQLDKFLRDNEEQGTVVMAAVQQASGGGFALVGGVAVCDPINENASYVMSLLRTMNIKTYMLSGDNETTAHAVARLCGIPPERVFANCLPKQKSTRISKLQAAGETVAMVGDGINDSPALTLADLGIAVGAGTDIAIKSADVVLIRSNLLDVAVFMHLARKTLQRIRLNFFFSFVYNLLCIPLAAGLFYPAFQLRLPPALAGFMMAMSSVSVVCSSLLLKYYKPPRVMDVDFDTSHKTVSTSLIDEGEGVVVEMPPRVLQKKGGYAPVEPAPVSPTSGGSGGEL